MEDIIVTLPDGTKMPKSQVPVGTIYINEKGQKVKKVLKAVPAQAQETKGKNLFRGLSQKINSGMESAKSTVSSALENGSKQLIKVSKNTIKKIGEKRKKATDNASAFMDNMMSRLIEKMQLDKTIKSLEDYQKESGKDVSNLIDFLKKIQLTK